MHALQAHLRVLLFSLVALSACNALLETCNEDSDCQFYTENSVCKTQECQCEENNVLSGDGTKCLPVALGYGEACEDDTQCSAALSTGGSCENNLCHCIDGFHYLKGKCWKSVPLNGTCNREEQCYAGYDFVGITCQNNQCVCRAEYYERGQACRRKLTTPGQVCFVDDDCFCPNGKCNKQACTCSEGTLPHLSELLMKPSFKATPPCEPGYFVKDGVCAPELGTDCNAQVNCATKVANALCIDNRECGCADGRAGSANNRACNKVASVYGFACTDNGPCSSFGANSICTKSGSKGSCVCMEGNHYDPVDKLCRNSKLIGEDCDVDYDCVAATVSGAECLNGKCACRTGNHEADGGKACRVDALKIGDVCVESIDCLLEHATCDDILHTCQCSGNYFAKDELCVAGLGSVCSDDKSCQNVEHGFCSDELCGCSEGVPAGDSSKCLPVVGANEKCQETVQCDSSMGALKECTEGICGCQAGSQYVLNRCYSIIGLGGKCKARAECVYPGSNPDAFICQNGVCTCQYGYNRQGDDCV